MTLIVETARIGYAGPDALNVTRKSGCALGVLFAPSWAILKPALEARTQAASAQRRNPREAAAILDRMWVQYTEAYVAEMRVSYRQHRAAWDAVLRREHVVLVGYQDDAQRCHRSVLAWIFGKFGADVRGETW